MYRQTVTTTVTWHELGEGDPPTHTLFPLILKTPEGLRTARYVGPDYVAEDGQSVVDGFLRGGWYFTAVTHWAYMSDILRAFDTPQDDAAAIKLALEVTFS